MNVDLEYRLAGLLAIERGQTRLNAVDPVSGIDLHFAPYNWCHRPMQLLSSKPATNAPEQPKHPQGWERP